MTISHHGSLRSRHLKVRYLQPNVNIQGTDTASEANNTAMQVMVIQQCNASDGIGPFVVQKYVELFFWVQYLEDPKVRTCIDQSL
jgi:hypothetical protein